MLDQHENGRFAVGLRLSRLGTLAPLTESLRALAQPFTEDLYAAIRQHVQLPILQNDEAVLTERLPAPRAVGLVSQVGGRLPLHCSAVGKVLLAYAEPELVEHVLAAGLRRYTDRTIVDPPVLTSGLGISRGLGWRPGITARAG